MESGFLPRRPVGLPPYVSKTGELCLAFPKGLGKQLCRGDPFFSSFPFPFTIPPAPPPNNTRTFQGGGSVFFGAVRGE